MNYCFDFIETPIIKLFVLDSSEGVHFLIKDNDKRIKNILTNSEIKNSAKSPLVDLNIISTFYKTAKLNIFSIC